MNGPGVLQLYREYQQGTGLSQSTIKRTGYFLSRFLRWLDDRDLRDVSRQDLSRYLAYLRQYISERGRPLAVSSITVELQTIRSFFYFLFTNDFVLSNPAEDFPVNLKGTRKLKAVFTEEQITLFLDSIIPDTDVGSRDRALFELVYSSALRISEALKLQVNQLNLDERTCFLAEAKGKKDRYVPISETAQYCLQRYLGRSRGALLRLYGTAGKRYVFPGKNGPLSQKSVRTYFKQYLRDCALDRQGFTLHSIRHAAATHLLEHGAGIRYVQELLGHEDLKTTQIYACPSVENIKAMYRTYHPRENEYWKEIDAEYIRDILQLKKELELSKQAERDRKTRQHLSFDNTRPS